MKERNIKSEKKQRKKIISKKIYKKIISRMKEKKIERKKNNKEIYIYIVIHRQICFVLSELISVVSHISFP